MMTTSTCYYLGGGGEEASSFQSEILLPVPVESVLERICSHHKLAPVKTDTRRSLSLISEELALNTLSKVFNSKHIKGTLDGFIMHFISSSVESSPVQSPSTPVKKSRSLFQVEEMSLLDFESPSPPKLLKREDSGGGGGGSARQFVPQIVALSELEFSKAFLLLSYIPGKSLSEVNITGEEIRQWKDLSMVEYERTVWNRLGQHHCLQKERVLVQWDNGRTRYYQCHVASDGSYRFKASIMENTGTHLHKVLGDDNVLTVKFDNVSSAEAYSNDSYSTYKGIAKNGIMVGLRRYQFFVFKDGGKEEKKKDYTTNGVKCYFIRTDSTSSNDLSKPYILSGMSIYQARMHFMHVNTLPSLAKYMARFSLILSKTRELQVDMNGINFEQIDDIHCRHHDEDDNDVLDKDGKPCIHSDGTGYISEDLARICPADICKGKSIKTDNIQSKVSNFEALGKELPLLIQFRMFYNGYTVKGTFLINKKLRPRTVQVRPSMIKVYNDQNLPDSRTFISLEVVTTSNPPRRTNLSRNLIALLSYGGVPNDFFVDILRDTLEKSKAVFHNRRSALKATLNYGNMDDNNAAQMILSGISLDEPYLKDHLSIVLNTEKNALREGKLPITESYYLMGTVDPTGKLKQNEVCVILETGQISGNVLVYRNPGLHFGDIHVLKATYVEALEDYVGNSKYAVFFPQKGPRSLGDEIAGGDFDGDMYFISRNPKLLEHFKPSRPWVSSSPPSKPYNGLKPSDFSPEMLEDELFKLFLKARFHSSNVVGAAADSWLAVMDTYLSLGDDSTEEKAGREKIMVKAIDTYYDALDAPKNGVKVNLPLDLKLSEYPHYMERDKSFQSTSILGLLFDMVGSYNSEEPSLSEIKKIPCFEVEPVPKVYTEECRRWYDKYKGEMSQVLDSGVKESANEIILKYKQEFYGASSFEESNKSLIQELYPKALALYNIAYDYAIKTNGFRLCGFVWKVAGPVLCRFYLKKMEEKSIICSASVLKEILG